MEGVSAVPAVPSAGANTLERLEQEVQRLGQGLEGLEQRLEQGLEHLQQQLLACSHNERARRHNLYIRVAPGRPALKPLRRETAAAAGGAHQLGALPPPGMFPADIVALWEVGVVRPCRLQALPGLVLRWRSRTTSHLPPCSSRMAR